MERIQKVLRRKQYSDSLRARQRLFTTHTRLITNLPTVYQTHTFIHDELPPYELHDSNDSQNTYEDYSNLQDVAVGLIKKKLVTNTKVTISVNENSFCVICQEKPDFGDVLRLLQCNHTFHIECIDTWFCDNKICPVCKQAI
jgi:plasmid rolling circle replication initiator protein Rep